MAKHFPVRFEPGGATVWVESGSTVLDAARRAGIIIDAPCGGRGVCGGCAVQLAGGRLAPPDEYELLGLRRAPSGLRLACRARIEGPAEIRPVLHRTARTLPAVPGAATGTRSDATPLVAGVDLGTSTVAAVLIERDSRVEVGRGVVLNRQAAWGADVLARISAACSGEGETLRQEAEASVLDSLLAACGEEGLCLASIERLVIAGNSAMAGLLLGADMSGLASYPFAAPVTRAERLSPESAITSALAPGAETMVLPSLAGFVGGDVLAGLLAEGLHGGARALFVDLGTNAEVVRASDGSFSVASAAAGPAFEGGGLGSGGPAAAGAVERVRYEPVRGLSVDVIGEGRPRWLCGSGLVSVVALLRRLGHLDAEGLMLAEGPLESHMSVRDGVRIFDLTAAAGDSDVEGNDASDTHIVVSQHDIRTLQLAKAAVRTAIEAVKAAEGGRRSLDPTVGEEMIVAGGFGSALVIEDLVELGVVPREWATRTRVAGNASLLGAAMIAVDPELAVVVSRIRESVEHVELALTGEFTKTYLSALRLEPYSLR